MATEARKTAIPKLPAAADAVGAAYSGGVFRKKEGVSLNQFINVAVAEKLAHLEHQEWARKQKPAADEKTGGQGTEAAR